MKQFKPPLTFFIIAEALSLFSQSAFMLVLPWLILTVTRSTAHTSLITTIVTVPSIIASFASGSIIDRIGRRRASIIATLGCAVAALGLAAATSAGIVNVAWLIGFGLLANLFLIPSMTARDTLMADVATAADITIEKLAGLRQLVFSVAFLAGPGCAGLLMTRLSSSFVLWLVGSLWIIAAVCTRFLPKGEHAPHAADLAETTKPLWRRALRNPALIVPLLVGFGTCLITAPMNDVLIPAHFRAMNQPQLFGWAMTIFAAGSLVGAGLYMVLAKYARATYIGSVLAITAGFVGIAMLPTFWILASMLFLIGIGASLTGPFMLVAITKHTAEHERGRMMSLYNTLSLGAAPVGLGLLWLLLQHTNVKGGLVATVVVWTIVAIIMLVGGKSIYTVSHDEAQ